MIKYSELPKEKIIHLIENTSDLSVLTQMKEQLVAHGYSLGGVLLTKLDRRVRTLYGFDVGPEPEWPGKNLPPITGIMRG
jgi:hypothetical protein